MAFKTMRQYNEERYGGMFRLPNNNDSANVVFLYRSIDDVMIIDAHYLKSSDYSGYVHCCGRGCPACGKGIRVQNKIFIPLLNLDAGPIGPNGRHTGEIQFWDRTTYFENQLNRDVFEKYPNPCQYVFTITREGESGSMDTKYTIRATSKYSAESYEQILNRFNIKMPDHFETVCRDISASEMSEMLNQHDSPAGDSLPDYSVTPRSTGRAATVSDMSTPVYTPVPEDDLIENPGEDLEEFGGSDVDNVDF